MTIPEPRFHLKDKNSKFPTLIVMQAKYNGHRVYLSAVEKINPIDWDLYKQRAIVTRRNLNDAGINIWLDKMSMKMDNLMAMGYLPLLNYFSSGINLEAKNIDVYKFINDNSAQVKHDLVIEDSSKERSDTIHIDMVVKKIGGNWKLDGAKAFGEKSKSVKKEVLQPVKFKSSHSTSINKNEILDKKTTTCQVNGSYSTNDEGDKVLNYLEKDKYFLISTTNIYEIEDGIIIKKWKIKDVYDDEVDIYIIKTYEGTEFYPHGFTKQEPSGEFIQYDVEWLKPNKVYINKEYINE